MKKVGILTYHYPENRNFGAILQAYASSIVVSKLGYDTRLINLNRYKFSVKSSTFKNKILLLLGGNKFRIFFNKFLNVTKDFQTFEELKELNKELDIFIVGSDQVWRIWNEKEFLPEYFLNFVLDEKRKISYAASFGLENWDEEEEITKEVKKLLKRFDYISVREESGVGICKNTFGVESVCVLDPTLVLPKEGYQSIIDEYKNKSHLKKKYIAHMLLDDNDTLRNYSNKIAERLKCEINYIMG